MTPRPNPAILSRKQDPVSAVMNEHARGNRRPASYRDVLDAPAHMVAELIEGALHLHPRPASRHALAGSSLGIEIGGPFQKGRNGPGGWWILDEPELHLGPDVLVPDLAGWRRERMPDFPDTPWFELPPDWVCEVLSPGTRRTDLTDKRRLYATAGVADLWFVDSGCPDPRGLCPSGGPLGAGHRPQGRRGGAGPALRGDLLPARGPLAGLGAATEAAPVRRSGRRRSPLPFPGATRPAKPRPVTPRGAACARACRRA